MKLLNEWSDKKDYNEPMEITLDRNNNVNNEKKLCIFLNDKIMLHEQNA